MLSEIIPGLEKIHSICNNSWVLKIGFTGAPKQRWVKEHSLPTASGGADEAYKGVTWFTSNWPRRHHSLQLGVILKIS